jgi:hypothetical protein
MDLSGHFCNQLYEAINLCLGIVHMGAYPDGIQPVFGNAADPHFLLEAKFEKLIVRHFPDAKSIYCAS